MNTQSENKVIELSEEELYLLAEFLKIHMDSLEN